MKKGNPKPEKTKKKKTPKTPQEKALRNKKIQDRIGYWFLLNLGTLMMAAGVYFFKVPNHFVTGGVSGLSILLKELNTPLTQSQWILIINIVLLLVGFLFLGKDCTAKTIYCSLVYSGENMLFEYCFPMDGPFTSDPLLELVYGMLLAGAGSAIIFNCRASSGGTDIIALILKKYTQLDVGKSLLVTDFFIAASTFFVYGTEIGLYSMAGLFAHAFLVDGIIESIGKTKYITIITATPEPIRQYILYTVKRSCTVQHVTGGYSGEEKTMIVTVCTRSQAIKLKAKVKEIDPQSFTIIADTSEILGKGFRGTL